MRAFRITDYTIPIMILNDPVIKAAIYEDGSGPTVPDIVHEYWIGVEIDGQVIACFRLHSEGRVNWQSHGRILPAFRKKYAVKATILAYKWAAKNIPEFHKIFGWVPVCHENVAAHLERIGMVKEGTLTESYLRDGKVIDQDLYGMTKQMIEEM